MRLTASATSAGDGTATVQESPVYRHPELDFTISGNSASVAEAVLESKRT
jgi:hypothetical protein